MDRWVACEGPGQFTNFLGPSAQTSQHSDTCPSGLGADDARRVAGEWTRGPWRALWAALPIWAGTGPPSPMGDWTPIETLCPALPFCLHPQDGQTQRPIMKMKNPGLSLK